MADGPAPSTALAAAELAELRRREQEAGITPDRALDDYMEAMSLQVRVGAFAKFNFDPDHNPYRWSMHGRTKPCAAMQPNSLCNVWELVAIIKSW